MNDTTEPPPDEVSTSIAAVMGWYGAVGVFLAVLLAAPIWSVANPPLVDYPNVLARGYILYHHDDVPSFREYLEIDYLSTPSLAIDLFMVALQPICEVRTVGKLFLTLTLWLWLLGWHLLGHAIHDRPTWLAWGGALVAYHSMFFYGFTNFAFSLGVFLIALAAWLHGRAHWPWPRHVLVALLALACFFSHLSAFLFLAGSVLAVTAWEGARARRISGRALLDVLPILVPMLCVRGGGQSGLAWDFPGKIVRAATLLRGYDRRLDLAFIAAVGVFLILLFVWSKRTRAIGSILFVGCGCVLMFLIGPHELFGGTPADSRFLPPAAALVVLSLDFVFPRKRALALFGLFLMLVIFRIGMIGYYWHGIDADLREQVALFETLPREAKVYPIVRVAEEAEQKKRELPLFHAIGYAVIDEHVYIPTLLAIKGHTTLRYKTPRVMFHADPEPFPAAAQVDWDLIFANHAYLWCWRAPDDYRKVLEARCRLVAQKGAGSVWRVRNR